MMIEPIIASEAVSRTTSSIYPATFARRMQGRHKCPLAAPFGLRNFGVNLTTLAPGAISSLQHSHSKQDEFVYVLTGEVTLVSGTKEWTLTAGMCVGFAAAGESHHLENRSTEVATYLEVGDRTAGDVVTYPADDLAAIGEANAWRLTDSNGVSY